MRVVLPTRSCFLLTVYPSLSKLQKAPTHDIVFQNPVIHGQGVTVRQTLFPRGNAEAQTLPGPLNLKVHYLQKQKRDYILNNKIHETVLDCDEVTFYAVP